jgi:hypothetical protein
MLLKSFFLVFIVLIGNTHAQLEEAKQFYEIAKIILEGLGAIGECEPPVLNANGDMPTLIQTTGALQIRLTEYKQSCPMVAKYGMILLYLVIRDKIMTARKVYRDGHADEAPNFANDPTKGFPDDYPFNSGMCLRLLAVVAQQWDSCDTTKVKYVGPAYQSYYAHCNEIQGFRPCQFEWQSCIFGYGEGTSQVKPAEGLTASEQCTFMGVCKEIGNIVEGDIILRDVRIWEHCYNGKLAINGNGESENPSDEPVDDSGVKPVEENPTATGFVQDKAHLIKNRIKRKITKRK